jgi:TonB-linked SusC/RagA family outer membrane protein
MRRFLSLFMVLMLTSIFASAQKKTVTGKVTDEAGNAIPFATVKEKGTGVGVSADESGDFKITIPPKAVLIVSATGYLTKETTASGNEFNVSLQTAANTMQEVIITAGGVKQKTREIGTAATQITSQTLNAGKAANVSSGLQGKVAGLMISNSSGGVNPNFRVVLRGQRSLTGNNQALLVLDNVIVPSDMLSNLNPEDVESVTVLNGAGAAALYGSQASNGALIVTTKKGRNGRTAVTLAHTTTLESVAFFPKIQKLFGAGGSSYGYDQFGNVNYSSIENQSYGPKFDGSTRDVGYPLENGDQLKLPYQYNPGHDDFWQTGVQNREDLTLTTGDDKSTLYFSGQFLKATGTTPGDKYNRASIRVNGTRKIRNSLLLTYNTGYTQNRYDLTTQTGNMFNNLLNMPSSVRITDYKNWRTDPFANENGFYNPWYQNPYFSADNYRQYTRNDYLTASVELKFTPVAGLDIVGRQGLATRNWTVETNNYAFTYSDYAKDNAGITKSDVPGYVDNSAGYYTELLTDFFANYNKKFGDYSLNILAGFQNRDDQQQSEFVSGNGLVVPGLFNVSNGVGTPGASSGKYKARQNGLYGEARIGYKDYLFLHGTARQDWVSILNPPNNTFFYPSVDLSFIANEAIGALKNSQVINFLKLRAGWSKVGQVNLGSANPYGAYRLDPIYGQAYGYPYGANPGFSAGNGLVSSALKPELTEGYEAGFDLNLLKDRITTSVTYYSSKTKDQTVNTSVAPSSGYTGLLTNVGVTQSNGWEITAHFTPVRTSNFQFTIGGNYTYLHNTVLSLYQDAPLAIATYGTGGPGSWAYQGKSFPVITGYDYKRDPNGRVIVDAITGMPSQNSDSLVIFGQAQPTHRLGIDGSFKYKGLTFSFLFEYRGGAVIYNNGGSTFDWAGTGIRTASYNRDRFVFPNSSYWDDAKKQYVANTNITVKDGNGNAGFWSDATANMDVSSNYVTSADFWKLRELSISYDLPDRLFGDKKYIKGATVSVQGRNLLIWLPKDNIYTDPEYSDAGYNSNGIGLTGLGQTPPSRFYGASVIFKF